jgi:integrase
VAKKRGNGEGCIHQRESDGRWMAYLSTGRDHETGKIKRVYYYGKTRAEVSNKLKLSLADQQCGTFIEPKKETFDHFIAQWLTAKNVSISASTRSKYERLSRVHIAPGLGDIEIQKLTRADIQKFITDKMETLSPKTLAEIHMIIKNILDLAVEDRVIVRNVCNKIELPIIVAPKIRILTEEEMSAILTACYGTRIYDVVFLEYGTGLRRGEILGLKWEDVNFDNNTISINKSWIVINGKAQWSDAEHGTKTESGTRVIAVPPQVMDELKKRQQPDNIYVFQSKTGLPMNPNNFRRDFAGHVAKAEGKINKERETQGLDPITLDISFHGLRHNYGTRLAALNVHQRLIEAQMGHKDYRSSRRYIHATQKGQHEAADKLGQAMTTIKAGSCQKVVKTKKKDSEKSQNP